MTGEHINNLVDYIKKNCPAYTNKKNLNNKKYISNIIYVWTIFSIVVSIFYTLEYFISQVFPCTFNMTKVWLININNIKFYKVMSLENSHVNFVNQM